MENITQKEYWAEVKGIVKECLRESEGDNDKAIDQILEYVDGHEWIIYPAYNDIILKYSSNDEYYFQNFGDIVEIKTVNDYSKFKTTLAFWALYGDCVEELNNKE